MLKKITRFFAAWNDYQRYSATRPHWEDLESEYYDRLAHPCKFRHFVQKWLRHDCRPWIFYAMVFERIWHDWRTWRASCKMQ